jgi:hypothetical protein
MREKMQAGTYCGTVEALRGRRALIRTDDATPKTVKAQFDDPVSLSEFGPPLNFGWHDFPAGAFDYDVEFDDGD